VGEETQDDKEESEVTVENMTLLTNADIREGVKMLTDRLRRYEADRKSSAPQAFELDPIGRSLEHRRVTEITFLTDLRPAAIAMCHELWRRLEMPPAFHGLPVAFHGMLAGVNPMTELADYLEKLARRLPNE
jgi:hypothetical protein